VIAVQRGPVHRKRRPVVICRLSDGLDLNTLYWPPHRGGWGARRSVALSITPIPIYAPKGQYMGGVARGNAMRQDIRMNKTMEGS
jgi:hypothetical protein